MDLARPVIALLLALSPAARADEVLVRADLAETSLVAVEALARVGGVAPASDRALPDLVGGDVLAVSSVSARRLSADALALTADGVAIAAWLDAPGRAVSLDEGPLPRATFWEGGRAASARVVHLWADRTVGVPILAPGPDCGRGCGEHAMCVGTGVGSAATCACQPGFAPDPVTRACVDVDECAADPCGPRATCTDLPGAFRCACAPGARWDGLECADVDECAEGTHACDPVADCENADPGHTCACPEGFEGDGATCVDVDECARQLDTCDLVATCENTEGDYACACPAGFDGDGHTCADMDECALGADDCDPDATCTNEPGGWSCECPAGWEGDGTACAPPPCAVAECGPGSTCDDSSGVAVCGCLPGWLDDGGDCLADVDGDGIPDEEDLCPDVADPEQEDADTDGVGDACEGQHTDTGDTGPADTDETDRGHTDEPIAPGGCDCDQGGSSRPLSPLLLLALARRRREALRS